jgi:hypothetical protein
VAAAAAAAAAAGWSAAAAAVLGAGVPLLGLEGKPIVGNAAAEPETRLLLCDTAACGEGQHKHYKT